MSKSCPVCVHMEREVKAEGGDGDPRQGRRQRNIDFFNYFLGARGSGFSAVGGAEMHFPRCCFTSKEGGDGGGGSGQKMPV